MMHLVPASDAHFAWMLGEAEAVDGLTLPLGGVAAPAILRWARRTTPTFGGCGSWLMVDAGEVVGTCGYKHAPTPAGDVEVGYGVAPERQARGYGRLAAVAA